MVYIWQSQFPNSSYSCPFSSWCLYICFYICVLNSAFQIWSLCHLGSFHALAIANSAAMNIAAAAKSLQSCLTLCNPHGQQPTRLPRPWDSPGKNTGVGCHFLLQCMNIEMHAYFKMRVFIFPYIYPGVCMLAYMVVLFLVI